MRFFQRTVAMVVTLALCPTFMPLGCGGSGGGFGPGVPEQGDAEVPERVALELRTCALAHEDHLGRGHARYSVSFSVKLANDGQVDRVVLRASTLEDEALEACMASALRLLSEDDLRLRRAENLSRGPVAPEARALLGDDTIADQYLLTMVVAMGLAYIGMEFFVQGASHPGTRTHPAKPQVQNPTKPDKDPKAGGDPTTTDPTPPIPPEPPKRKPRCEDVFPRVVNCSYIQQAKYPDRKSALEAVIKSLPGERQKRPFTTKGTQPSTEREGADHTTYWSADGRTKISIGCYKQCCKNTEDEPVIEEGMKCYELNTAYMDTRR